MPTNKFFQHTTYENEQNLVRSLIGEAIEIQGINIYYIPRTMIEENALFGEDKTSLFSKAFQIECIIESVDGFEGTDFFGKLGIEVQDSLKLIIPKAAFERITLMVRPNEGDVVYFPLSGTFFEILFVEHEAPFYQLGKNYVFRLDVQTFRYGQEEINTGIPEIDKLQTDLNNDNNIDNDPLADNDNIEDEADSGVIDFNDGSPFGNF